MLHLARFATGLLALAAPSPAAAAAPSPAAHVVASVPPDPTPRAGLDLALRVSALGSLASLSSDYESVDPYAAFEAFGPELALELGGFLASSFALGARLAHSQQWTTEPDVRSVGAPSGSAGASVNATLLGPYLAVYPSASSAWVLGAAAGLGRATFPDFAFTAHGLTAAFFSLELGFELRRWSSRAVVFYRGVAASDLEREGMRSHDIGLGWRLGIAGP